MPHQNLELFRRTVEAYNARDIEAFIAYHDPDVEFHSTFAGIGGGAGGAWLPPGGGGGRGRQAAPGFPGPPSPPWAAPASAHIGTAPRAPIAGATALFDGQAKAFAAQASVAEPPIVATPRANCEPGGIPEGPMQGRVSADDVAAGRVDRGYICNMTVVGHSGSTGGFRGHRYVDRNGH